uniref:Uncharacterized protein n=1 Tax=Oryza punctata TaxID=4537 RepID=A0A0E0JRM7_ORYPU
MVIRIIQIVITGTSGFQTPYWNRISLSPPTLLCLVYRRRRLPPSSPVAAAGRSGREGGDIIISQREAHTTAQVDENERLDLDLDDLDEAVGELLLDFFLLLFLGGFVSNVRNTGVLQKFFVYRAKHVLICHVPS